MIRSAYVHIPFCHDVCNCCAFQRTLNLSLKKAWFKRITKEIEEELSKQKKGNSDFTLKTLYFGGGTPSLLELEEIESLASIFEPYLDQNGYEWTMEANPDDLDLMKLKTMKKAGINRLSLGLQSFDQNLLTGLRRHHSPKQNKDVFDLARQAGFDNISVDWMIAMPDESMEQMEADLKEFLALKAEHLSLYTWIKEDNSIWGVQDVPLVDEDLEADQYEAAIAGLKKAGYTHYEVSAFCLYDHYSRHNLAYWQDQDYLAFGYGACGRDAGGLYHHEGSLARYINDGYQKVYDDDQNRAVEAIETGLRTIFGLNMEEWNRRYQQDFETLFAPALKRNSHLLIMEDGYVRCNDRGLEVLDSILVDFLMCV